jgi:hypothetical protein
MVNARLLHNELTRHKGQCESSRWDWSKKGRNAAVVCARGPATGGRHRTRASELFTTVSAASLGIQIRLGATCLLFFVLVSCSLDPVRFDG